MSFIGSALLGGLSLSSAEKAFRPWWDTVEDSIVYTLIVLSLIVAPGTFIVMSSVDCNYCQGTDCTAWRGGDVEDNTNSDDVNAAHSASPYNLQFVKQFCSRTLHLTYSRNESLFPNAGLVLSGLMAYYPYILLLFSTVLVLVDRPFVSVLFKSFNIEQVYKLLVLDDPFTQTLDKTKEGHELYSCMGSISHFFASYLKRTILSLVVSIVPLSYLLVNLWMNYENFSIATFPCWVHNRLYECAGFPVHFYKIVLNIFMSLLGMYILLNLWNLVWLMNPRLSPINVIMSKYKAVKTGSSLDRIYFKNRNVQLLLALLTSSSGVAYPLRGLALMDKNLSESLIPEIEVFPVQGEYAPSTVVRLVIQPNSFLEKVSTSPSCCVTFCLETGDEGSHLLEFTSRYELILSDPMESLLPMQVSTSINGKIVALKKMKKCTTL